VALAIAGCDDLAHIPANVCGNHVVEAPEECDGFPDGVCHAPGGDNECRIDCSKRPCAPGAGCGVDHVCRVPSGKFSSSRIDQNDFFGILTASDLNGDGRSDLLVRGTGSMSAALFNRDRTMRVAGEVNLPMAQLSLGYLNDDKGMDMVSFRPAVGNTGDNSVRVMFADSAGVPTTQSLLAPAPDGKQPDMTSRRLFAADIDGNGTMDPLMIVDQTLWRVPPRSFAPFEKLFDFQLDAGLLNSSITVADFDAGTRCSEVALSSWGGGGFEGSDSPLQVYSLCPDDPEKALITQIALPQNVYITEPGVLAGDVDGDGNQDLVVTTPLDGDESGTPDSDYEQIHVYVSYGLGDGTFHSSPPQPGLPGDNRLSAKPLVLPQAPLLAVGQLDWDGRADFVLNDRLILSTKSETPCKQRKDFSCGRALGEPWTGAVVADFTHDGIPDVVGAPEDIQAVSFLLGLSSGGFNEFSIPTEGLVGDYYSSANKLVPGDFDGDETLDLAFVQSKGLNEGATLSVLFGKQLGPPSDLRELGTVVGVADLCAGRLFQRNDELSDLVMLAFEDEEDYSKQGVGLFAGQTNRLMFSPLGVPEPAETGGDVQLEDVVLGRFHGAPDKPESRDDLIMLAKNKDNARLLYYLENTDHGFDTSKLAEARTRLDGVDPDAQLSMVAFDLDGDKLEEALIYPNTIGKDGRLTYFVVRWDVTDPRHKTLKATLNGVEVQGLPGRVVASVDDQHRRREPRDVNGDTKPDLLLYMSTPESDEAEEFHYFEIVFPNTGTDRLGIGAAFDTGDSSDAEYLNIDDDPQLELAVASFFDEAVKVFELDLGKHELFSPVAIPTSASSVLLEAGDFDGNGVEDLATLGVFTGIFWGEARNP
jgi:hypothetical protein